MPAPVALLVVSRYALPGYVTDDCMVRTAGWYQRQTHVGSMHLTSGVCIGPYAAWHQMVPICPERWCTEANEATQTHCYNSVAPAYPVWAFMRMDDNADANEILFAPLPSGRLEKTNRSSPWLSTVQQDLKQHHLTLPEAADLAQNRSLWRIMSTYDATQSLELRARNDDDGWLILGLEALSH